MSSRSKLAIALTVALLATVYLCIYAFKQSINELNMYREHVERSEMAQALAHLTTSVLYLLLATIILLVAGILLYVLVTALLFDKNAT
jgi:hypothetical protein